MSWLFKKDSKNDCSTISRDERPTLTPLFAWARLSEKACQGPILGCAHEWGQVGVSGGSARRLSQNSAVKWELSLKVKVWMWTKITGWWTGYSLLKLVFPLQNVRTQPEGHEELKCLGNYCYFKLKLIHLVFAMLKDSYGKRWPLYYREWGIIVDNFINSSWFSVLSSTK